MAATPALQARFSQFISTQPKIILGSSSSSRRVIMDELAAVWGFSYSVMTADIDEQAPELRSPRPQDLVVGLARAKRDAIVAKMAQQQQQLEDAYLITCDQVVVHAGRVLEKPSTADEVREYARGYSAEPPSTVGSVLVTNMASGKECEAVDVSTCFFSPIPDAVVEKLIEEGDCFHCAGGLMIEHELVAPHLQRIEGTEDGVRGLAKALVITLLLDCWRQSAGDITQSAAE